MASNRRAALIVDDQPFVGMVTSDILRETGFDTFHAYDAQDALELLRRHPEIDVVITGRDLPGDMDGVELSQRVAAERPTVQLVVTAKDHERRIADLPRGARVLRKPYASAELRTLVSTATLLQDA